MRDRATATPSRHWFVSPSFDLGFFHVPVWLCWLIAFAVPSSIRQAEVPVWVWVVAVLMIDVGHVWSSIYRTYLDPVARKNHAVLLRVVPIICFALCLFIALQGDQMFWRVLAYVATFHFIKQQVGVAALYRYRNLQAAQIKRNDPLMRRMANLDKWTVYAGTLCPVIFWHLQPDKRIAWFIPGDYLPLHQVTHWLAQQPGGPMALSVLGGLFYAIWFGLPLAWLIAHVAWRKRAGFPFGKTLWIMGTWFNWYLGIVYFDSDLVFTITNVVAHGIPYYGLIGLYGSRKLEVRGYGQRAPILPKAPTARAMLWVSFLIPILMLAFGEEYFWNAMVYRDYHIVFADFLPFPKDVVTHPWWKAVWIALLSLPQVVHYVLDGFIWKFNGSNPDLKQFLMGSPPRT